MMKGLSGHTYEVLIMKMTKGTGIDLEYTCRGSKHRKSGVTGLGD